MISQRLLPRIDGGRVPSIEVMVTNSRIQDLIREDRPDEITDAIAAGEFFQMQTFAQSLIDLVISGVVDRDVAANAATNRHDFIVELERAEKNAAHESVRPRKARSCPHRIRRSAPACASAESIPAGPALASARSTRTSSPSPPRSNPR